MRVKKKSFLVIVAGIILSSLILTLMNADARCIALPGFLAIVMVLWLWVFLWDNDKTIPFFDIGFFCALATLLYTVFPLLNYWMGDFQFDFLSDARLHAYHISPYQLGVFHFRHVTYLFSFVLIYTIFRGRGSLQTGNIILPNSVTRKVIITYFLILTCYFFVLYIATGVNYNGSYQLEAYTKKWSAFSSLPLFMLQISSKLNVLLFFFKMALLFIVASQCKKRNWFIFLILWIIFEIICNFYIKGARSSLVLFILSAMLFYHRMVKSINFKFLFFSAIILISFFMFMGVYRFYSNISSMQLGLFSSRSSIFTSSNEFQALLGTEYDVLQRKIAGAVFPWYLYINDIINILPPQQFMPFKKVSAAEWYISELGLSGKGQGFMWGVITQSIIGFDWFELILRGGLLGYILAYVHRWYIKNQTGFLPTLIYVYLCINVFDTFRNTTLSILSHFVWEIVPFYLLLYLGIKVFSLKVKLS